MGRRTRIVIAVVVALPVLVGAVAWLVETDEEAIERVTDEARRALLRGDLEGVLARLTPDATAAGGVGRGALADRARYWVDQVDRWLEDLTLSSRKIVVEGDGARAEWVVTARSRRGDLPRMVRFVADLEYRREPDGWRIRSASARSWSP